MKRWLLKTEPDEFSFEDLVAAGAGGEMWDGVRNHQAAGFLRQMAVGDQAFIYHSRTTRAVVGSATITRAAFPDPTDASGRFVAVRLRALEPLPRPVTLAEIKKISAFDDFLLVRQSRLSVMPVSAAQWRRLVTLARR